MRRRSRKGSLNVIMNGVVVCFRKEDVVVEVDGSTVNWSVTGRLRGSKLAAEGLARDIGL